MQLRPRSFLAPNASPMTLDGTRTYAVGRSMLAIIDPGSADPEHLDTLADVIAGARQAVIIVTHDHPDHSAGALELAELTGARLLDPRAGGGGHKQPAQERTAESPGRVRTDEGDLVVLPTPGHAPEHISLHWPAASAIFCGDLMMGGLDTTVVAAPEGDLRAYLESLDRLKALRPSVIYPAHGPPFTDPDAAIGRYVRHRHERLAQVRAALEQGERETAAITDRVYGGTVDPGLRQFAESAVEAYVAYLRTSERVT